MNSYLIFPCDLYKSLIHDMHFCLLCYQLVYQKKAQERSSYASVPTPEAVLDIVCKNSVNLLVPVILIDDACA